MRTTTPALRLRLAQPILLSQHAQPILLHHTKPNLFFYTTTSATFSGIPQQTYICCPFRRSGPPIWLCVLAAWYHIFRVSLVDAAGVSLILLNRLPWFHHSDCARSLLDSVSGLTTPQPRQPPLPLPPRPQPMTVGSLSKKNTITTTTTTSTIIITSTTTYVCPSSFCCLKVLLPVVLASMLLCDSLDAVFGSGVIVIFVGI